MGRLTRDQAEELLRLRGEGWGWRRLAERYGISVSGARSRVLRAAGVPYRSSVAHLLLGTRHSPAVEAALVALAPGYRRLLDEDDERRGRGR